jgi:hypothetical protein
MLIILFVYYKLFSHIEDPEIKDRCDFAATFLLQFALITLFVSFAVWVPVLNYAETIQNEALHECAASILTRFVVSAVLALI